MIAFTSAHFKRAQTRRRRQCFWIWLIYVVFLDGRVTCICGCRDQQLTMVFLSPCSDFQCRFVPVFNAVLHEDLKIPAINTGLWTCPDSLYLSIILCIVDYEFLKFFATLYCWTICPCSVWSTLSHSFYRKAFVPNYDTDLVPINLMVFF